MSDVGFDFSLVRSAIGDEHVLARLLNDLPDVVIVIDAHGGVLWANRTAEEVFGRSVAEVVGTSGLDLVHPDDLELVLRSLSSVQGKQVGAPIEVRLQTVAGWQLMELLGSPVTWVHPGAVLLTVRDLTQRRRFELVHNHDSRLRSLVQNSTAITMLVSPDGCLESASGALTRVLGHDPELVEGRPLAELVPEADREVLEGAFERASRGASVAGPVTVTLSLYRHGNRGVLPFELAFVNLIDDPTVGGYVVTGHDVTDRLQADLELRKALSLLRATLDATADGILAVDIEGHIVSFNQRLVDMWQVPKDLLEAKDVPNITEYVREKLVDPSAFAGQVEDTYQGPVMDRSDVLEFKDGRVFERFSKLQRVDGDVVGRVWSFRNLTDRKQMRAGCQDQR